MGSDIAGRRFAKRRTGVASEGWMARAFPAAIRAAERNGLASAHAHAVQGLPRTRVACGDIELRCGFTKLLLSVSALDEVWTDQAGADYGFGFGVRDTPAGKVVGHGGGFQGISSNLDIFADAGFVVAVMSNYSGGASSIDGRIRSLVGRVTD